MNLLDELAERMVPAAVRLAVAVHDGDTTESRAALEPLSTRELHALCTTLAAMVPDDETLGELLAWTRGIAPVSDRQAAANRARLAEVVEVGYRRSRRRPA